ncbi:MAG: peptidylprolyl isomerase [Janthinobacterium lividum]
MRRPLLVLLAAVLASPVAAAPTPPRPAPPRPATVRVRMDTNLGPIVIDLDVRHAPITATNFLTYVDEHRFDGTSFYRAAPGKTDPHRGFVQGGIDVDVTRARFPIAHEPTTLTGIHHTDGTISMAREQPGTAAGNFTIMVGDQLFMDARPGFPGYAAFGQVVSGMTTVRAMLALPTYPGGRSAAMLNQTLRRPVRIVHVYRVTPTPPR